MSTFAAPISKDFRASTIEEAARHFVSPPKAFKLLELHRSAILTLRARGATYAQICDLLKEYRVIVSEAAITRFCRKHRAEVQRLRLLQEQEVDEPATSTPASRPMISTPAITVTPNPTAPTSRKVRDLRGEV